MVELHSLPWTVQRLVAKHKIKKLHLVSREHPVQYITPSDVLSQLSKLKMIQRFLDQPGSA